MAGAQADARKRHLFGGGSMTAGPEETLRRKSISRPSDVGLLKAAKSDALTETDKTNVPNQEMAIVKKAKTVREVVEKDGFRFKRRKKQDPAPAPAAAPAEPQPQPQPSTSCPSRSSGPVVPEYPREEGVLAIHEALPAQWSEEKRLLQLCENVCVMEEDAVRAVFAGEHGFVSQAVDGALREFQLGIEQAVLRGEVALGEDKEAARREALAARKHKLRALRDKFIQEQQEWEEIRTRDVLALGAAGGRGVAMAGEDERAALEGAASAARAEVAATGGRGAGALATVCADAHCSITFQVDALVSMVKAVEASGARAEALTRSLQSDFHAEKFKSFPHVDSPQALIKTLTGA